MFINPSSILPKLSHKIKTIPSRSIPCGLFTDFKPMAGGQTAFWDLVPLSAIAHLDCRWIWLLGGIGAGKSITGAAFICSRAFLDPTARLLITANSYPQLTTSTLIALVEFCDLFHIPLSPRASTTEETAKAIAMRRLCKIFDASVLVISAEAFSGTTATAQETGRGMQIRYCWADEYAYAKKSVFETLNGRLGRGAGVGKGLGVITSSINKNNPYNFAHSLFIEPERSDEEKKLFVSINAHSIDNTALDPDYVSALESSYTPELADMELRGIFSVQTENRAFNHFDRRKHVRAIAIEPRATWAVSFDFNRHPATAVIGQIVGSNIHIVKEFYLLNSDTFALAAKVAEELNRIKNTYSFFVPFNLFGDATGRAKTANSQFSNWQIVDTALSPFWHNKKVGQSNPPIVDTLNTVNSLLYHGRIVIDPSCKELIRDLETVALDGKGGLDKKTDILRCQVVDGFRYLCHETFPITSKPAARTPTGPKYAPIM